MTLATLAQRLRAPDDVGRSGRVRPRLAASAFRACPRIGVSVAIIDGHPPHTSRLHHRRIEANVVAGSSRRTLSPGVHIR